jgi:hypothetical protein
VGIQNLPLVEESVLDLIALKYTALIYPLALSQSPLQSMVLGVHGVPGPIVVLHAEVALKLEGGNVTIRHHKMEAWNALVATLNTKVVTHMLVKMLRNWDNGLRG